MLCREDDDDIGWAIMESVLYQPIAAGAGSQNVQGEDAIGVTASMSQIGYLENIF